jgi:hypothetical protein
VDVLVLVKGKSPWKNGIYMLDTIVLHCKEENPIYLFPEKKLRSLSHNFHIHVAASNLYIPKIGPSIFL